MKLTNTESRLAERKEALPVAQSPTPAASVSKEKTPDSQAEAQEARIRELAYRLYEERGRRNGNDMQDWLEAESIIRERDKSAA